MYYLPDDPGTYVSIPQFRIMFPSSATYISRFKPTLEALLLLRTELEFIGNLLKRQLELIEEKRNSIGSNFNRPSSPLPPHKFKSWQRKTWYTPPRDDSSLSHLPSDFLSE